MARYVINSANTNDARSSNSKIYYFFMKLIFLFRTIIDTIRFILQKRFVKKPKILEKIEFLDKSFPITKYYVMGNVVHLTADHELSELLMSYYRRDENSIFNGHKSMDALFESINEIYEGKLDKEDSVVTCNGLNIAKYHAVISDIKYTEANKQKINKIISDSIESTKYISLSRNVLDLNVFCKIIISKIFCEIYFNYENELDTFGLVENLNARIQTLLGKKYPRPENMISNQEIRDMISKITDNNPNLFQDHDLTMHQKYLMIIVILFASHENTFESLKYLIYDRVINFGFMGSTRKIIDNALNKFVPVFGIARLIKDDIEIFDDTNSKKYIMKKDEIFGIYNEWMENDKYIFGLGPHECPGKKFTYYIFGLIINYFNTHYEITNIYDDTHNDYNIKLKFTHLITKKINNNLHIVINEKDKSVDSDEDA